MWPDPGIFSILSYT